MRLAERHEAHPVTHRHAAVPASRLHLVHATNEREIETCGFLVAADPTLMRGAAMKSTVDAPDWSTIPAPVDDGATRHLAGARMAFIPLQATNGETVTLSALPGRTIVYAYPSDGETRHR